METYEWLWDTTQGVQARMDQAEWVIIAIKYKENGFPTTRGNTVICEGRVVIACRGINVSSPN